MCLLREYPKPEKRRVRGGASRLEVCEQLAVVVFGGIRPQQLEIARRAHGPPAKHGPPGEDEDCHAE